MNTIENKQPLFSSVKDGETFNVGEFEFIKFPEVDGKTPVVMKNIAFRSRFGKDNDFRNSEILKKLQTEILPKIVAVVGEENVCTFKTDLTTWDGLKTYGEMESKISLPTMDFYRAHVSIFDQHKPDSWWWLATADSAQPHYDPIWALCVSPSGCVFNDLYYFDRGVRPFCIFESSIFGSSEA